uniref:Uncharacterized protein n=1 Tax=Wolfiporia cocos TaxID=81056 RepID=A0A7G7YDV5_9APHY|nr:hypothetical protein [Wolfiporia cocos]
MYGLIGGSAGYVVLTNSSGFGETNKLGVRYYSSQSSRQVNVILGDNFVLIQNTNFIDSINLSFNLEGESNFDVVYEIKEIDPFVLLIKDRLNRIHHNQLMINKQQNKFASGVNTDFSKKYTALINKLQNEVKVWKLEINSLFFLSSVFISLFENLDVALLRKELLDLFNESTVVYYLVNKNISMDNIIELIISYGISNIWVNGLIKTNLNRNKNDNTVNFWDNLSVLFIFKADKIINGIINTLKSKIVLTSTVDQMVFNKLDDFILNIVSIISENGYVDNSLLNSSDIFWEYLMKVANFIAKLNNPVFSNMFYNSLSNIEKEFRVNIAERMVYHKTSRKSPWTTRTC